MEQAKNSAVQTVHFAMKPLEKFYPERCVVSPEILFSEQQTKREEDKLSEEHKISDEIHRETSKILCSNWTIKNLSSNSRQK